MPSPINFLPHDKVNRRMFAAFLAILAISCIRLPYLDYFGMQHVPTVLAVVALVVAERKGLLDRLGFTLIVVFLLLHVLGARYLYSYTPYDDWSQALLGFQITDRFGFERNHYDRLVHFCFGLLLTYPLVRFFGHNLRLPGSWPALLAVCVITAAGAVYEIGEWLTALVFAPDWADAYVGQQGDPWDAHWDMAVAMLGSVIAIGFVVVRTNKNSSDTV
jgi:putative membrane protein